MDEAQLRFQQSREFAQVVAQLQSKENERAHMERSVEKLGAAMEPVTESDEWLRETLEKYEERMALYAAKVEEKAANYQALSNEITGARGNLEAKMVEQGGHEANKKHHEKELEQ